MIFSSIAHCQNQLMCDLGFLVCCYNLPHYITDENLAMFTDDAGITISGKRTYELAEKAKNAIDESSSIIKTS